MFTFNLLFISVFFCVVGSYSCFCMFISQVFKAMFVCLIGFHCYLIEFW